MKKSTKNIILSTTALTTVVTAGAVATAKMFHSTFYRKKGKYVMFRDTEKQSVRNFVMSKDFEELQLTAHDGTILKGHFLKNENSDKLIICVHGYHSSNFRTYSEYIEFYYNLGFNILIPNNRGHGNSQGNIIGFGWLDRLDIKQWIDKMMLMLGKDIKIVLKGISMGSATVLMLSGEQLPNNVKCIVADCGFTSVYNEVKYAAHGYNPVLEYIAVPIIEKLSKPLLGYNLKEASALEQVKKSKTPTLFIHGDQDTFVPTYMVYELFEACSADKDLFIVEGATHGKSHATDTVNYEKKVSEFINHYL